MRTKIKFGQSEGLSIGIVQGCGKSQGLKLPKIEDILCHHPVAVSVSTG